MAGQISGYQCYIYANAVYYYLFGDIPYHGSGISGYWKDSKTVLKNQSSASYSRFSNAGVGFGAYIRTTANSDGSYSGSYGHSLIVLTYDSSGITYLDCNSNGKGLVRIARETWSEFNSSQVSGKSRRIAHVVQCKSAGEVNDPSTCPGKAALNVQTTVGGTAAFTWKETDNTTHYNICIKQRDGNGKYETIAEHSYVEPGFSVALDPGEYCAQLISYNSNKKESDGKDWKHTYADDVNFEIRECNHTFSSAVDKAATCAREGKETYICKKCGYSYSSVLPMVDHEYVTDPAQAATCTNIGLTEGKHCSVCKAVLEAQETINALGHSYSDGICTDCGDEFGRIEAPVVKITNKASSGKPSLSWDAVDGAVEYEVYRATSKTGKYSRMKTLNNTTYTNTSSTAGKYYYYYVRAIAADGSYADSSIVGRTCDLAQTTVAVSNVVSTGKVKISWEPVEGATKYEVYRAASKNGTYSRISTTSSTSVTNTKAEAGKMYYYKVRAICDVEAAAAAYSASKSRTCNLPQPDVSIALSSKKPKVSWDKVEGAVSYKVYRASSKNGTYSLVKTTTSLSYKDSNATSGKTYYYKVVAVCSNTAGNSNYSGIVSIKST